MQLCGSPFDFVIAFLAGILASLTPCVYPLIPISAGYIVGNAQNSRSRGLLLSLFYVTGMAITYSLLGILAVLTGSIFGKFSSSPVVNLISGIFILIFGLAMFDIFHFSFIFKFRFPTVKKGGYATSLLLGLVSGLMISPCLTPMLASILAYLSITKNVFYGGFLLFCFSYGMGLIFILIGTFGAASLNLPKAGKWMIWVKYVCAAIVVLAGLYCIIAAMRRF